MWRRAVSVSVGEFVSRGYQRNRGDKVTQNFLTFNETADYTSLLAIFTCITKAEYRVSKPHHNVRAWLYSFTN